MRTHFHPGAVPRLLGTYRRQSRLSSAQPRPPHAEPRYLPAGSGRLPQPAENRHRNRQPLYWARIQQKIAETYYLEGKISANREALEEALACYHDALYIFETAKRAQAAEEARTGIAKTRQMLAELAPDAEEEETEDFTQP